MSIRLEKVVHNYFINLYQNNEIYIGNKVNNKREGYGKYFNKNVYYIGEWSNNYYNGEGYLKKNDIINNNSFNNNKFIKGNIIYLSGYIYKGEILDNKKNGYGEMFYNNILICKGIWENNKLICNDKKQNIVNNFGHLQYVVSSIIFIEDVLFLPENEVISEYIHKNKINKINKIKNQPYILHNDMTYYLVYKGFYKNNMFDGDGELYIDLNNIYKKNYYYIGKFKKNKFHGKGTLYNILNNTPEILFEGNFEENKIVDTHVTINNFTIKPFFKYTGEIYNAPENENEYIFNIIRKKGEYINFEQNIIINGEWLNNIENNLDINKPISIYRLCNIQNIYKNEYNKNIIFQGIKLIDNYHYEGTLYSDNIIFEGKIHMSLESLNFCNTIQYINGKLYFNTVNKPIISEGNYKYNELNGIGKKYKNSILESEGYYINNKLNNWNNRNNICNYYYSNSKLKYSGIFLNDKPHGECSLFNESGILIGIFNFLHGEINN